MPSSTPCRQDEGWSPRMVVHHLADSESNSYVRLRKLLAEDRPIVQCYDEASTHAGCTTTGRSMDDWLEIYAAHAFARGADPARSRRRLAPTSSD